MGQSIAIIIITVFIGFLFIPMAFLTANQYQVEDIKQNLNLSAKALIHSIDRNYINTDRIAGGFVRNPIEDININKEKLLNEFYATLYNNYLSESSFEEIKSRLVIKILVLHDRFYIANLQDQWSAPFFFIHLVEEKQLYLNTRDDYAYYYDLGGERIHESIEVYGISGEVKNNVIIDKINAIVASETTLFSGDGQLVIEIQNPEKNDPAYRRKYQNFNVLEGITFFVIYREESEIEVNQLNFQHKNYSLVGYTLR